MNSEILEVLQKMHNRESGLVRAEVEYILQLHFKDTKKINEILKEGKTEIEE